MRKPRNLKFSDHTGDSVGCHFLHGEGVVVLSATKEVIYTVPACLTPKQCRKLAAWLTKAADWMESRNAGEGRKL